MFFSFKKMLLNYWALPILLASAASCTSFQGEYSDPEKAEIVDDKWNETDARKTAEVLITSCLGRPWLANFKATHNNQAPVVVVADVENRTDEHIDTKALTEFIQNELINSGKVRFVNKERRQQILDEVNYQHSGNVSDKTRKKKGNQIGADYMLAGAISSHVHSQGGLKKVTYQTVLNLTNLETSEIQWNEKHEVSKRFKRSGSGW